MRLILVSEDNIEHVYNAAACLGKVSNDRTAVEPRRAVESQVVRDGDGNVQDFGCRRKLQGRPSLHIVLDRRLKCDGRSTTQNFISVAAFWLMQVLNYRTLLLSWKWTLDLFRLFRVIAWIVTDVDSEYYYIIIK